MNPPFTDYIWCDADLRFYTRHDANDPRQRKYRPNAQTGDLIPRYHQPDLADVMECPSISIHTPDWSDHTTVPSKFHNHPDGYFYAHRTKHGHNWFGVTRVLITFYPRHSPFIYQGHLFTGGTNSTCKLRRLRMHQLVMSRMITNPFSLPWGTRFEPLDHLITLATFKLRRDVRKYGWEHRGDWIEWFLTNINGKWNLHPSYDAALKARLLSRMGLAAA